MSKSYYSAVVLGTVVEGIVAEQFRKAIEPYTTEQVIEGFIHSVANGDLKITKVGGTNESLHGSD